MNIHRGRGRGRGQQYRRPPQPPPTPQLVVVVHLDDALRGLVIGQRGATVQATQRALHGAPLGFTAPAGGCRQVG